MKYSIKKNIEIQIPKGMDILNRKRKAGSDFDIATGYLSDENDLFAICKYPIHKKEMWWVVHRPSLKLFALFSRKKDAESFLSVFLDQIDTNEIRFMTPVYSQIKKEILEAYSKAYAKAWSQGRL